SGPGQKPGSPAMAPGVAPMQRAGFHARNARGMRLHNVTVADQVGPAFVLQDATDIDVGGSGTPTPDPDAPVIVLQDVEGAFIHNCRASTGTGTFLQVAGATTRDIVLNGNALERADTPVSYGTDVPSTVCSING
ncbi:MAG: hypothetical protein JXA33_25145, partial [Anaerolineae bacterium]|nr:hypothetical protein [Anaerolineae bacterium]